MRKLVYGALNESQGFFSIRTEKIFAINGSGKVIKCFCALFSNSGKKSAAALIFLDPDTQKAIRSRRTNASPAEHH